MIRVKICCISSLDETKTAVKAGANALGLVGKMPSGPGVINDEMIAQISALVPPGVSSFLLTSEVTAEGIIAHYQRTLPQVLQLVDRVDVAEYLHLRQQLPNVKIVQVIHVLDESSIQEAMRYSKIADALLLDSGNPDLTIKQLGGTGKVHNWDLSRGIVNLSSIPVYLAGGLHPGNIAEAISKVQPFGIDICSGVRTDGKLDEKKLAELMRVIREMK